MTSETWDRFSQTGWTRWPYAVDGAIILRWITYTISLWNQSPVLTWIVKWRQELETGIRRLVERPFPLTSAVGCSVKKQTQLVLYHRSKNLVSSFQMVFFLPPGNSIWTNPLVVCPDWIWFPRLTAPFKKKTPTRIEHFSNAQNWNGGTESLETRSRLNAQTCTARKMRGAASREARRWRILEGELHVLAMLMALLGHRSLPRPSCSPVRGSSWPFPGWWGFLAE